MFASALAQSSQLICDPRRSVCQLRSSSSRHTLRGLLAQVKSSSSPARVLSLIAWPGLRRQHFSSSTRTQQTMKRPPSRQNAGVRESLLRSSREIPSTEGGLPFSPASTSRRRESVRCELRFFRRVGRTLEIETVAVGVDDRSNPHAIPDEGALGGDSPCFEVEIERQRILADKADANAHSEFFSG